MNWCLSISICYFIFGAVFSPALCRRENDVSDLQLKFYNGKTVTEHITYTLANFTKIVNAKNFDINGKTLLYIHGYEESTKSVSVKVIVNTYIRFRPDTNIIVLDWINMCTGPYMTNAAPNSETVAKAVAYYLLQVIAMGLEPSNLHLVGHSLGCHVAGNIAKTTKLSGVMLHRVTGLDCAFPLFFPAVTVRRLTTEDALFVDTVHTDSKRFGIPLSEGHAVFWPNGGQRPQPGCRVSNLFHSITLADAFNEACSHQRAWKFFAESVINPKAFVGVECKSYDEFMANRCSKNGVAYMGYGALSTTQGDYYLQTNAKYPYGKGRDGIKYVAPEEVSEGS